MCENSPEEMMELGEYTNIGHTNNRRNNFQYPSHDIYTRPRNEVLPSTYATNNSNINPYYHNNNNNLYEMRIMLNNVLKDLFKQYEKKCEKYRKKLGKNDPKYVYMSKEKNDIWLWILLGTGIGISITTLIGVIFFLLGRLHR